MKDLSKKTDTSQRESIDEQEMEILVARKAGFCMGVERALNMVMDAVRDSQKGSIYTYGPLIHNPQVVKYLESLGVKVASSIDEIPDGSRVVIRSHGIGPEMRSLLERKNFELIDATCKFVIKAQQMARQLYEEGYQVVILGLKDHPEVVALREYTNNEALVFSTLDEIKNLQNPPDKLGVICQTTLNTEFFGHAIDRLRAMVPDLVVKNTICDATAKRQEAARNIAEEVDAMIVIGGKQSSNTRKLTDICRDRGVDTYQIETPDELRKGWFLGRKRIGVTAGASTPDWMIEEVIRAIGDFGFRRRSDQMILDMDKALK
jgi:4-hydroxy-3-methylbut-2-enyl diphosphate reductase